MEETAAGGRLEVGENAISSVAWEAASGDSIVVTVGIYFLVIGGMAGRDERRDHQLWVKEKVGMGDLYYNFWSLNLK